MKQREGPVDLVQLAPLSRETPKEFSLGVSSFLHLKGNELRQKKREYVAWLKSNTPCKDCKKYYPFYVMDFDHVDGTKVANITVMTNGYRPFMQLLMEIAKCEIVCANCHRERTQKRIKNDN